MSRQFPTELEAKVNGFRCDLVQTETMTHLDKVLSFIDLEVQNAIDDDNSDMEINVPDFMHVGHFWVSAQENEEEDSADILYDRLITALCRHVAIFLKDIPLDFLENNLDLIDMNHTVVRVLHTQRWANYKESLSYEATSFQIQDGETLRTFNTNMEAVIWFNNKPQEWREESGAEIMYII